MCAAWGHVLCMPLSDSTVVYLPAVRALPCLITFWPVTIAFGRKQAHSPYKLDAGGKMRKLSLGFPFDYH